MGNTNFSPRSGPTHLSAAASSPAGKGAPPGVPWLARGPQARTPQAGAPLSVSRNRWDFFLFPLVHIYKEGGR